MGAHVIWTGPVSAQQRAGATIAGATEHFVPCVGAACRAMAEGWRDADGRHLPALLAQLGIPEGEDLYLGAFSAGGSAWKQLLQHPLDRAAIRAVALADATYELAGSDGRPASSPSLVAYASEAAASGTQFLLATASANANNVGGVAQPSGADTLTRLVSDLEQGLGQPLAVQSWIPGQSLDDLHPARVWLAGAPNVVLCDFGSQFQHPQHATVLAPRLWPAVLQPWVDGGAGQGQGEAVAPAADSSTDPGATADPATTTTSSSTSTDPSSTSTDPTIATDPTMASSTAPTASPTDPTPDATTDADADAIPPPSADDSIGLFDVALALGTIVGFAALVQAWQRRATQVPTVPGFPGLRRFR